VNPSSRRSVAAKLDTVRELNRTVKVGAAEELMRAIINSLSPAEMRSPSPRLQAALDSFFPKRKRALMNLIRTRLERSPDIDVLDTDSGTVHAERPHKELASSLRQSLRVLSDRHIFEWSTHYRDEVAQWFDCLVALLVDDPEDRAALSVMREEFARHAEDIYVKGFSYQTELVSRPGQDPILKSLNGLQRFLELPLEAYSSRLQNTTEADDAALTRSVCSAMIAGILEGYGQVRFHEQSGWQVLPRYAVAVRWASYLPFMTYPDADRVVAQLEAGPFREGLTRCFLPTVRAIDQLLCDPAAAVFCPPQIGQFSQASRRIEALTLLPRSARQRRHLVIQCYLDQASVHIRDLEEAANRGVALIVAPLRADAHEWVDAQGSLKSIVVNAMVVEPDGITQRAKDIIASNVQAYSGAGKSVAPIQYNFARDFPLHSPFIQRYFRVQRESVRSLLRAFDARTGVRLWCSVRRSGKTTACFDLDSTSGASVVLQTCVTTEQYANSHLLYDRVSIALSRGMPISHRLLSDVVTDYTDKPIFPNTKIVFLLDEYESLFTHMKLAIRRDPELRYTVVQPVLNQMVAFSRDNLLVLIGQRPDAHYIIMDQNQLSPYIEQDLFPLFSHHPGEATSEFRDLLTRILSERLDFEDSLYGETGGHPFLTVNVLTDFFEWLIEKRRPAVPPLTAEDFGEFSPARLGDRTIAVCREYEFFRQLIREAISEQTAQSDPWLHAVYSIMRKIASDSPTSMSCSMAELRAITDELRVPDLCGYTAEQLLAGAERSNFLTREGDRVVPRVRLMARISSTVNPETQW
jgi:hypothetical protein